MLQSQRSTLLLGFLLAFFFSNCFNRKQEVDPTRIEAVPSPGYLSSYAKSEDDLSMVILEVVKDTGSFSRLKPYLSTIDILKILAPGEIGDRNQNEVVETVIKPSHLRLKNNFHKLHRHVSSEGVDFSQLEILNFTREPVEIGSENGVPDNVKMWIFKLDLADRKHMFSGVFTITEHNKELFILELITSIPKVKPRS